MRSPRLTEVTAPRRCRLARAGAAHAVRVVTYLVFIFISFEGFVHLFARQFRRLAAGTVEDF